MTDGTETTLKGLADQEECWLRAALQLKPAETPFPWQLELLRRFGTADIPRSLDIPTGLGKTSVMALWLLARAGGAKIPRRLVYVVDRRAVVDQATEVAEALRNLVDHESELKGLLGIDAGGSLPISTLRGQHVDNREWLHDPSSVAIIVGTVDMIGSRLLFEGYRVSPKMRPYQAGLLGVDTLVALDEAHLVPPFEKLLEKIMSARDDFGPHGAEPKQLIPQFRLISLSATGRDGGQDSLTLTEADTDHPAVQADLDHPVVRKRLRAPKNLRLRQLSTGENLPEVLAESAWSLTGAGEKAARIIVFCDSRSDAETTAGVLKKMIAARGVTDEPIETELFVGGRRVFERERAKARLEELGFLAGREHTRGSASFLVATSAAEVGVDLDADHMVSDLVAWERMVQRLGRVNRRGEGVATVIAVAEPEPGPKSKKERQALEKLETDENISERERRKLEDTVRDLRDRQRRWQRRQNAIRQLPEKDGGFDASPGALRELSLRAKSDDGLRELLQKAMTPEPLRPPLTRPLVEAWSMTSLDDHTGRPAIDPWLRGWDESDEPQTAIIWRKFLPLIDGRRTTEAEVARFFEAAPPHTSEVLETETSRHVVPWIEKRAKAVLKKALGDNAAEIGQLAPNQLTAIVLSRSGKPIRTLDLSDLNPEKSASRKEWAENLTQVLTGATLVVDARLGGLAESGLLDENESVIPRTADDGEPWIDQGVPGFRIEGRQPDEKAELASEWQERYRFPRRITSEGEPTDWLVIYKWLQNAATEEDRSASRRLQALDEHQQWAEQRAREIARRIDLDEAHSEMLAVAARLHDEGKRSRRWQHAFNAPTGGPWAKTKGPISYKLLDGYRHELGSLLTAEKDERLHSLPEDLSDLALHLITSHHGFGHPMISTRSVDAAPPSTVRAKALESALRFARLQQRWGPWGLAWWESLLRAADFQASADNDAAISSNVPEETG